MSIAEHGPEDVDTAAGKCDECLVMALALPSFAVVEGSTNRMVQRAEG